MMTMTSYSKNYSQIKTYQGELITEALNRETSSGKRVWWFALKTKKEIVDMQAWENSCDGDFSRLHLGVLITASGYFKAVNVLDANTKTFVSDKGNEVFVVKAFFFTGETRKPRDFKEQIIREYGSLGKWKEEIRAFVNRRIDKNQYPIIESDGTLGFRSEDYVVKVGGRIIEKIEFVMDCLGAEKVTRELSELTNGGSLNFMTSKEGAKKYREWLDNAVLRSKTSLEKGKIPAEPLITHKQLEQRIINENEVQRGED